MLEQLFEMLENSEAFDDPDAMRGFDEFIDSYKPSNDLTELDRMSGELAELVTRERERAFGIGFKTAVRLIIDGLVSTDGSGI